MTKKTFRYSFEIGRQIRYLIKINGGLDILTPLETISHPIKLDMGISHKIVTCDDDEAVLRIQIDSLDVMSQMSSEHLPEIGSGSIMKIDRMGRVHWIDGKAAWDGAEHSFLAFPEYAIQSGDTWTMAIERPVGSAPPLHTKYRFNGFDRRKEYLNNFSTEVFEGHLDEADAKSLGKGSFSFNSNDGWIEESGIFLRYEYSMPLPNDPAVKLKTITGLRIDMERVTES